MKKVYQLHNKSYLKHVIFSFALRDLEVCIRTLSMIEILISYLSLCLYYIYISIPLIHLISPHVAPNVCLRVKCSEMQFCNRNLFQRREIYVLTVIPNTSQTRGGLIWMAMLTRTCSDGDFRRDHML